MAFTLDQIRATADRVAASHGLEVVTIEFLGGPKQRALRVYIEKSAAERARLAEAAVHAVQAPEEAPGGLRADRLAGVTHEDCEAFSKDFGTVLDVEDLIPGSEYLLEVSSPGLDRGLFSRKDYERFRGSLVKLRTFEPVAGNRHWQGRLTEVGAESVTLDLQETKPKGKQKKAGAIQVVEIALGNIEKANLVPEF